MKYAHKSLPVDAVYYNNANYQEIADFSGLEPIILSDTAWQANAAPPVIVFSVPTLEGAVTLYPGCYLVRGTFGEYWPVRGDIFKATYDPIPDAPDLSAALTASLADLDAALAQTSNQDLAMMLKLAEPAITDLFLSRISRRLADMIRDDMEVMGPIRRKDAEDAQRRFLSRLG